MPPWALPPSGDEIMTVKDPVCGMELEERDVRFTSEYEGKTYSFCSLACKKKFDENPEMYLRAMEP
jgi:YHS domain-containing protein